MDYFQDVERQQALRGKLDKELQTAPWTQKTSEQTLEKLEKIVNTVNLVHEGFCKQNDADILYRLNMAAQKLKDSRAEAKKDTSQEAHQPEDQELPSNQCLACQSPLEQHLVESKDTPSPGASRRGSARNPYGTFS